MRNNSFMSDSVRRKAQTYHQIAPQSWEHPADRAALETLRSVPGFDQIVKKTIGFFGETGIRATFQANAVLVGPSQYANLNQIMNEVLVTLDWREEVPLFISQTPWFNAGAYGVDHPFIVLNSTTLDILGEDELRVVLGHEVGHVISGHSLYRTMLALILAISLRNLPFLTGIALLPIRLALQEWSRKSELSSDRAALLACGNVDHALSMFLRAAGGTITQNAELNLLAYREQVNEYQRRGGVDSIFKLLNLLDQSHPYHTLRASELLKWSESDTYQAILNGHYRKRAEVSPEYRYSADVGEAASYYANEVKEKASEISETARLVAEQASIHAKQAAREAKNAMKVVADEATGRIFDLFNRRDKS